MSPVAGIIIGVLALVFSSLALTASIENIGSKLRFSDSLTGALLSPMFTALPELIIIAEAIILIGRSPGSEIAAGTIIGEPFMVSSLGMPAAVIVLSISKRKRGELEKIDGSLSRIMLLLGIVFPIMLIPHFLNTILVRIAVSLCLVLIYVALIFLLKGQEEISGKRIPSKLFIVLVTAGLILLLSGSTILVSSINEFANQSGISRELMGILIIPIGTIVPETMNSLVWASKYRTNLSISALLGEELMFTTIFPAIGIAASSWIITYYGIVAVVLFSSFSIVVGFVLSRLKGVVYPMLAYFASFVIFLFFVY
ncbi:MAG: hypothetical protein QXN66_03050 [Thermoplasmatales archaeon]